MQPDVETDRAANVVTAVQPFQLRGRFLTAIALRLDAPPDEAFYAALDLRLQQVPQFFSEAPVVIDVGPVAGRVDRAALQGLVERLRSRDLDVFGVQNADAALKEAARSVGLISLPAGRETPLRGAFRKEEPREVPAAPVEVVTPKAPENRMVTAPVRSGQTVVAERGDLIVVGHVSSGAELVAAGNIHVYGRMRGRAMAGIEGDESARIFCRSLDAELLAVAGLYRTSESIGAEVRKRPVQVYLEDERLRVEPLG